MATGNQLLVVLGLGVSVLVMNLVKHMFHTPYDANTSDTDGDGIADKAVINLQEFLEFQKIEKLARKSRVMQLCMSDRGYRVNPAWLNSHQAEAHALALRENISDDAAVEELKRQHMYPGSVQETPFFWAAINKKANS